MSEQGLGVTNYMIALVAELKADVRRLEAERDALREALVGIIKSNGADYGAWQKGKAVLDAAQKVQQ